MEELRYIAATSLLFLLLHMTHLPCGISRWGLRPSGLWRSVGWFITDISEQPANSIFKGQDVLERLFNAYWAKFRYKYSALTF